ncbi:hypothetical protein BGZ89_008613 [Linnemannia elongata]|nr:hypothetical protein BGZ89_008613 [Linnemannia elongata]
MPPRFVAPAAPKCPRCTKSVYSAEQIIGPNGAAWHKACYTCRECNRRLDSNILAEHEGEAYCKTCHKKMWGPTGYGYASGLLVREDPESQFKQSIGRPPNSAGSQNNDNDNDNTNTNSGSYATLDEVVYNNTGGSNRSAGRGYHDSNSNSGETEEERRERLTPVNATLKKRSSLDMIREQAEASRRAYDEAHNQRIANKYGKVTTNSTGGSTASVGSRSDLHLGGSGSHLHAQSGYISAGSDTSSAFGSTKATTSSPAPSFSSISSTASSQPATKSLFLNQSYRTTSSASTASHQDAESDYARSRQALNFQTGAPAPVSSGPPSLPKRAPEPVVEPVRDTTPTQQYQDEQRAADDDFEDYMPIRVVARKEEAAPAPAPTAASAVEEDEQQDKREQEQREQAQREQEYLDRARAASSAAPAPVSSSSTSSVSSTPTSSARLNRLISETDKLTLKEQEQRHAQPASSAAASGDTSYYRSGGLMTPKKMTTSFGGGGDICPRCQKTVYHAESALAPGGAKYHKLCLRCVECSKSLDSTNMTDRQGTPYCKACYSKAWGAKGYGYGSGASMLHTEL